ncbi:MAG: hypothetical protein K9G59_08960 [Caulobacter sp.]|nr:hypothetical protein [Caulobacter sp.]
MTWLGGVFHRGCERQAKIGRSAMGLLHGALVGASLTAVIWLLWASSPLSGVALALMVFPVAFLIWAAGLILAAPGWLLLHVLGARCQQAAMIYGGGVLLAIVLAFLSGARMPLEDWRVFLTASLMVVAGVTVGWVVAKVAYRPAALP